VRLGLRLRGLRGLVSNGTRTAVYGTWGSGENSLVGAAFQKVEARHRRVRLSTPARMPQDLGNIF
jgi:hypothetical protein